MKKNTFQRILRLIWKYFMFFSLISVTVTCCMSLFLNVFSSNMGITYTAENIDIAAKLTFGNVILLTLLFTVIDNVRRKRKQRIKLCKVIFPCVFPKLTAL